MKLKEAMSTNVQYIDANATLADASKQMKEHNIGLMPVVDEGSLHGTITDRDIVVRGIAEGHTPDSATVREAMTQGVVYASEDDQLEDAVQKMREHSVRRLLVADSESNLTGVISLGDLASSCPDVAMVGETERQVAQAPPQS
jgi:CBS domain-containing protein